MGKNTGELQRATGKANHDHLVSSQQHSRQLASTQHLSPPNTGLCSCGRKTLARGWFLIWGLHTVAELAWSLCGARFVLTLTLLWLALSGSASARCLFLSNRGRCLSTIAYAGLRTNRLGTEHTSPVRQPLLTIGQQKIHKLVKAVYLGSDDALHSTRMPRGDVYLGRCLVCPPKEHKGPFADALNDRLNRVKHGGVLDSFQVLCCALAHERFLCRSSIFLFFILFLHTQLCLTIAEETNLIASVGVNLLVLASTTVYRRCWTFETFSIPS